MKAVLHFAPSRRAVGVIAGIAAPDITIVPEDDAAAFRDEIADAEVLLHVLKPVTADMIAMGPRLRLIQKIGVGVNTIDLAAARAAGIAVANMPGTNTQAVAEHTLCLMLAVLRRVPVLDAATRAGRGWQMSGDESEALGEIAGRTVGFVGYGAVPKRLTPVLLALGARVRFWNRSPRPDAQAEAVALDELLQTSDILSLHVPSQAETRHLLNRDRIRRLKPGAIVINSARGELIDQTALFDSMRDGSVIGAGLDVFEAEPLADASALHGLPSLVATPHVAWLTPETIDRSLAVIVENCRRLSAGEPLLHRIV